MSINICTSLFSNYEFDDLFISFSSRSFDYSNFEHIVIIICISIGATNVRLSGGSHTMEGRVEIKIDGTWSSLCDEEWNDNEATIICKMLTAYPLNR